MKGSDFHEICTNSRNRNRVIKREIKVIISMYITTKSFCGNKKGSFLRHINISHIKKMHQRLFGLKNMTNQPNGSLLSLSMVVYSMVTSNGFSLKEYNQRSSIFISTSDQRGLLLFFRKSGIS